MFKKKSAFLKKVLGFFISRATGDLLPLSRVNVSLGDGS